MTTIEAPILDDETNPIHRREIKSFVRREGRTTPAQERALNSLLPIYGIDYCQEQQLDLAHIFGNKSRVARNRFWHGTQLSHNGRDDATD